VVNPVLAKAIDQIFILHADHEQNASTSTVRLAAHRALTRLPALVPVLHLFGVLRTVVQRAVLNMLIEIGSKDKIPELFRV